MGAYFSFSAFPLAVSTSPPRCGLALYPWYVAILIIFYFCFPSHTALLPLPSLRPKNAAVSLSLSLSGITHVNARTYMHRAVTRKQSGKGSVEVASVGGGGERGRRWRAREAVLKGTGAHVLQSPPFDAHTHTLTEPITRSTEVRHIHARACPRRGDGGVHPHNWPLARRRSACSLGRYGISRCAHSFIH